MKKLVACDNFTWIEVSDRLEKGANCPCPSSCKNFKKGKCSDRSSFKVIKFKEVEDNDMRYGCFRPNALTLLHCKLIIAHFQH